MSSGWSHLLAMVLGVAFGVSMTLSFIEPKTEGCCCTPNCPCKDCPCVVSCHPECHK